MASGEHRGDLLGAELGPGPGRPRRAAIQRLQFVLGGLANHAGPDGTCQSCYAVGLHPCQFTGAIAVPRSPSLKSLILRAAMDRASLPNMRCLPMTSLPPPSGADRPVLAHSRAAK